MRGVLIDLFSCLSFRLRIVIVAGSVLHRVGVHTTAVWFGIYGEPGNFVQPHVGTVLRHLPDIGFDACDWNIVDASRVGPPVSICTLMITIRGSLSNQILPLTFEPLRPIFRNLASGCLRCLENVPASRDHVFLKNAIFFPAKSRLARDPNLKPQLEENFSSNLQPLRPFEVADVT